MDNHENDAGSDRSVDRRFHSDDVSNFLTDIGGTREN